MANLRRLPWATENGGSAFVPGDSDGPIAALADSMEAEMLTLADADIAGARALVDSRCEDPLLLRTVLQRLALSSSDAVRVARLRGERIAPVEFPEGVEALGDMLRARQASRDVI